VRVIDHGLGIPRDEQEKIFSKFYRGSNVRGGTQGLGIGLFVAKGLAARLRAELSVESRAERGSVFVLALPWSGAASSEAQHAAEGGARGQASRR
jgi:signal transduction histidine kinase